MFMRGRCRPATQGCVISFSSPIRKTATSRDTHSFGRIKYFTYGHWSQTNSFPSYLLTPWSRDLLQKLIGSQLVKKVPAFYGTRRFINAFTRHLSHIDPVHALTSRFLRIHLNIILPSTPWSYKWSLSPRFPQQNPAYTSTLRHTCYMPRPPHSSRDDQPNNI